MIILMFWKLSFCFIDLNCSWFFSERTVSRPSCLWFPKTVHSLLNVEFLPKILKTIQAVDMRPHSSLNNRTRNFSCDSATLILGADNAAGQATYCRKTSGFPKHSKCTPYSPLLSPCIHHYYPLPFTPSSPSSSCSWHSFFLEQKNMSINRPLSLRSTPLMLQLLESERSDIFEKTWRYRKDTCQGVGISSVSDSPDSIPIVLINTLSFLGNLSATVCHSTARRGSASESTLASWGRVPCCNRIGWLSALNSNSRVRNSILWLWLT